MDYIQAVKNLLHEIEVSVKENSFVKLTLSKPRQKGELKNIYIRYITLKNEPHFSFTFHYDTKDEVQNASIKASLELIEDQLSTTFLHANLFTTQFDINLETSKKGKVRWQKKTATLKKIPPRQHDREKRRHVTSDRPYLKHLGITSKEGKVLKSAQSKYKQIDKYIEIMDDLLQEIKTDQPLKIVDMGSGKGYLTFALYDYLVHEQQRPIEIVGIELRQHLVDFCNKVAEIVGFEQLSFVAQDIRDYPAASIDILIALHACDIATDIAIAKGIQSKASLIVCAPCCHKQIRKQIASQNILTPILKHGILEERQAEMITDGIRALIMEQCGYQSKVFEFISNEHTGKNLMIVGTKTDVINESAAVQVAMIKEQFGIQYHYLEQLL